jgi:hypothetical protein
MRLAGAPRRFSLEVRLDQSPIQGCLYAEEGQVVRPFTGWLGLLAAIEAIPAAPEKEGALGRPARPSRPTRAD